MSSNYGSRMGGMYHSNQMNGSSRNRAVPSNHHRLIPSNNTTSSNNQHEDLIRYICDSWNKVSQEVDKNSSVFYYQEQEPNHPNTPFDFSTLEECFGAFDKDNDTHLNQAEFGDLCKSLFCNANGQSYEIRAETVRDMFAIFDVNHDGLIDKTEFIQCWNHWIKTIVQPVSAVLVIDVQNDFITGSLNIRNGPAQQNGEDVIQPINNLLENVEFDGVFYSHDWHPSEHVSFIDNIRLRKLHSSSTIKLDQARVYDVVTFDTEPPMVQKLWPKHCVQNTWGAELDKHLRVVETGVKIYKGTNPDVDSYSLFWDNRRLADTKLEELLREKHVTDLYLCGLAYDVCVASTARDAIASGYRTVILDDCCRGVDLVDIEKTKSFVKTNHGLVLESAMVKNMVDGLDRRPELGYKLALELRNKRQ